VWVDGSARDVTAELRARGLGIASSSPGMGAVIDELGLDLTTARDRPNANLRTVGRVNDLAYGNVDSRLERTPLERDGWVNFDRINTDEAAVHLRVTAMEVETGRLRVFGNSNDLNASQMKQERIELDHIIASCSIPIIYPATELNGVLYWDGGTVANTPLSPAIDAGAEEIVVVLMTPWDDEGNGESRRPRNLLEAAGVAFEWALLASFQADLKMFRRVNTLVRLQLENARLKAVNATLMAQLYAKNPVELEDKDGDGIPDLLQKDYHNLPEPVIVAPRRPIPVEQIISYTLEGNEAVYEMGYEDAKRAWRESGRQVEGEG
jgi:NTE family protein